LERSYRDVRVTDVGEGKVQRPEGGPCLCREPELVDDVLGDAILIVIDFDAVEDGVIEVEVVRAIAGLLARDHIGDEHHLTRILPAPEKVHVGVVRRRIQRDQRRLAVTGRPGARDDAREGHQQRHERGQE